MAYDAVLSGTEIQMSRANLMHFNLESSLIPIMVFSNVTLSNLIDND